ncbi:MAG: hypothetical protein B6I19_01685 [Bacteroidetes bacterium 4572_114]|nr:MAG: hypothetical protein B6I19_01685 [Bacteroidetes bacterium 4572_114]
MPETTLGGIGKIEGLVMLSASRFFGDGPQHDTEILLFDANGNPFHYTYSETLNLLIDEAAAERCQLRIYDLLGQLMHSEEIILGQSSKLVSIQIGYFKPGVYLAEVISLPNQKHNTFKIIKK